MHRFFLCATINTKIFTSEIEHRKHRSPPPPCLYEPHAQSPRMLKPLLELAVSVKKTVSLVKAQIVYTLFSLVRINALVLAFAVLFYQKC